MATETDTGRAGREAALPAFFRESEIVEAFRNDHQSGEYPWGSLVDHAGRIVVADHDRSVLYAIRAGEAGFDVLKFEDAMAALDPEIEPEPGEMSRMDGMLLASGVPDPETAFRTMCEDAGLDLPAAPVP